MVEPVWVFVREVASGFWRPEQPWVVVLALIAWWILRRTLPPGSHYVHRQTMTFLVLCLLGELGASFMDAMGWDRVAGSLGEFFILGTGIAMIRFGGLLLFRVLMPAFRFETPRILEDITVISAYVAWGMVRLRIAGLDLSQIVATSAVVTAIIAFSMQDTLGNILGGLAIHLDHSVEIGDWVVIEGISGRVIDIRWRYTKIMTRNGEKIVMPNSVLMKNKFSVVGIYGGSANAWRRWVWFNVGLDHAPHRVIEVAGRAVTDAEIPNVARNPAPSVVLMEFGAGYARYALRYWLTDPLYDDPTDSEVRIHVFNALERAGLALALPEEVRHLTSGNAEQALPERELQRRLAALSAVELFHSLSADERQTVAVALHPAPFARGDIMTRQGAVADSLYIIVAGEAAVWLEGDAGGRHPLGTLSAGGVFGEMGLMTGAARNATVIARDDVDCYRLDKAGLESVLLARPALVEDISRILAVREAELEKARQGLEAMPHSGHHAHHHARILERITRFFGLPRPD
ncbi:MAG: mechanosensitive ion channel [Proteobacteria bacterium]|nr:mechanosensitive ion channel [Pseudomonadota bacterium]HQR04307.1 mechanosensitive ion channel family protein [Rhodocyclaceae bacterium]